MTNPAFRYFYPSMWDEPKRWVIPPVDNAENKECYRRVFFTPCFFNNDAIPDYFIAVWPEDLASGCGSASASSIHLLIVSDGEDYRLHNDPLRRQYKALQRWFGDEYQEPYEQQSPWVGVGTPDKQSDTFILDGICYDYYLELNLQPTLYTPVLPKSGGYTTLDCKEYAHVYYYFASDADSIARHWTTILYH